MPTQMRALVILLALSACAPKLHFANEAGGVVNKTGSAGSDRAYAIAREHCARSGKIARITNDDRFAAKMHFECVVRP